MKLCSALTLKLCLLNVEYLTSYSQKLIDKTECNMNVKLHLGQSKIVFHTHNGTLFTERRILDILLSEDERKSKPDV